MEDFLQNKIKELKLYNRSNCLIASDYDLSEDVFLNTLAQSFLNGTGMVIYCPHTFSDKEILKRAGKIKNLCEEFDVTFIIKSRIDIAYAAGADGVHLDSNSIPALYAREILGDNTIIGFSGYSDNADYLLLNTYKQHAQTDLPVYIYNQSNENFLTALKVKQ